MASRFLKNAISRAASITKAALQIGVGIEVHVRGASSPFILPGCAPDPIWRFLALLEAIPQKDAPPRPRARGRVVEIPIRPGSQENAA